MKNVRNIFLATGLILTSAAFAFAQSSTPKAAVESFYKFDRSHSQVFNRRNIDARKPWFSPALYSLFLKELKRQAAFERRNPNEKPYFGDGLPFQPYDETCKAGRRELHKTLVIKQEFQRARHAAATATFAFPRACTERDTNVYTIGLIKVGSRWLIDDVNYGEDTTLQERLKRKEY
jgi:hypothetical protein